MIRIFAAATILELTALVALPLAAQAQGFSLPISSAQTTAAPYGVAVKRINNFDTAPVTFQGQRLFTVAVPASNDNAEVPQVVQRVYIIESNLRQIAPASISAKGVRFDANTFKVEIGNDSGDPVLYATDGIKHDKFPIMTVTQPDTAFNAVPKQELAQQWATTLQGTLVRAIVASEPGYVREQLRKLPWVLLGVALATIAIVWLRRRLRKTGRALDSETRRAVYAGLLWALGLAALAIWAFTVYWLLTIFPATRAYANQLSGRAFQVVLLWAVIAVLDRLIGAFIVRATDAWRSNIMLTADQRARIKLRSPTLIRSADNLKSIVLWAIAIVWTFAILSVSAVSLLTIGAVVAFAFSFATQSLIKDYLNGFLILAEDQFAIGDMVTIGGVTGTVEDLTLRITRLRADDGRLVTIPNSTITTVENSTRSWARVDFRVSVAASANVERATAVLQDALDKLAADPAWSKDIIEPPQVLGVDSVSYAGVVLRAWIKTIPSERAPLAREINLRVGEAFRRNGIAIGAPQAVIMQQAAAPEPARRPQPPPPPAPRASS